MPNENNIEQRLDRIERLLMMNKPVLNFSEAVLYTGISASTLYKLTSSRSIRHSKPSGKLIFFDREDLDNWMRMGRVKTNDEINQEAITYATIK